MSKKQKEDVPAETFEEARDKDTGPYVSDEDAEENPDKVVVEEFIVLRERKDPRVRHQRDKRTKRPL